MRATRNRATRSRVCLMRVSWLLLVSVCWLSPAAAADAMFVGDFDALGRDWKLNVDRALTVEGRVSTKSPRELRFVESELRVTLPPGTRRFSTTDRVEVSGLLRNDNGRPRLEAFSVKPIAKTELWLADVAAQIQPDDPATYFAAADTIRQRGTFYKDDALLARAGELDVKGLEAMALQAGLNTGELRGVVLVAAERKQPPALVQPLLFKAVQLDWNAVLPRLSVDGPGAANVVLAQAADDLPGALVPQPSVPAELAAAYRDDALAAYQAATPEQRLVLDRLLYGDMLELTAAAGVADDDANADELADELSETLPDRPQIAAEYRRRGADALLAAVASMTEADAVALAERLGQSRGEAAKQLTLTRWLESRRAAARLDGAVALFTLAQDTERLTGDLAATAALMIAASDADTRFGPARQWLLDHGYERKAGRWQSKNADRKIATPPDEVGQPLVVGITGEQARQRAGILPDRTARLVSRGRLLEFWVYRDLGVTLTVERQAGRSTVIAVKQRTAAN